MINGFYKTYCSAAYGLTGDKEYIVDLKENMTLHTVYVSNFYYLNQFSYYIGTTEIRLGNDSSAYSTVNSVVWPALYDGGFFPIGTT